ncbi:hypothetical protein JCM11251_001400 [Rhodosporidiobolus azoricus]
MFSLSRFSSFSSASTSSSSSSGFPPSSPGLSFASASTASTFDLLEPVDQDELPHLFVVERSLAAPSSKSHPTYHGQQSHSSHTHSHSHSKRPRCSLHDSFEGEKQSVFSFPRNHTTHSVCPRHGIVHDPALALPDRDSRSASSSSSTSSAASCSSKGSGRSFKCALRRLRTGDRF